MPSTLLPDEATLRRALESAVLAPSVYNSQPWHWRGDSASGIDLFADRDRHLTTIDIAGRDLLLSCGAALRHLVVALAGLGWSARVDRFPDPEDSEHLAHVTPSADVPPVALARLAGAIPLRRTDRRRFGSEPVPPALLDDLVEQARDGGAEMHVVTAGTTRAGLIATISRSASLQRQQAGYTAELARWTGRYGAARDGIESSTVAGGAPLPGDVPMRRFTRPGLTQPGHGLGHEDASTLMVLSARTDDRLGTLCAGEATGAVLLTATELGLATTPLSQPLEVEETRRWISEHIVGAGLYPQLVIRVGRPAPGSPPLPPTPRRPVDRVLLRDP